MPPFPTAQPQDATCRLQVLSAGRRPLSRSLPSRGKEDHSRCVGLGCRWVGPLSLTTLFLCAPRLTAGAVTLPGLHLVSVATGNWQPSFITSPGQATHLPLSGRFGSPGQDQHCARQPPVLFSYQGCLRSYLKGWSEPQRAGSGQVRSPIPAPALFLVTRAHRAGPLLCVLIHQAALVWCWQLVPQ